MSVRLFSIAISITLLLLLPLMALDLAGANVVQAAPPAQSSPTAEPCGPEGNSICTPTLTPAPATTASPDTSTEGGDPEATTDDLWLEPLNLSQSGAASTFRTVVDQSGAMHVIWQETESEWFSYVEGNGLEWTSPLTVEVPFGTLAYYPDLATSEPVPLFWPELVPGADGRIHAFWIDETGTLQFSSVDAEEFSSFSAWDERESLSEGVLALDVISKSNGQVHLAYISSVQIEESPPGVYYRRLSEADEVWSEPNLLYPSLYLGSITAEQANIQITTSNGGANVIVVWDDPLLEKVFQARSGDSGQSWAPASQVDGRELDDDATGNGPSKISVGASGNNILLLWQAGHGAVLCGQYYQTSTDSGVSWGPRSRLESPTGCADQKQLIANDNTPIFLLTSNLDNTYLLAWNGERWSEAIVQNPLNEFINPNTNQLVQLGCHEARLAGAEQLLVFGCNESGVADIWFISRPVGSVAEWFPAPPAWSDPELGFSSAGEMRELNLVTDTEGRLHFLWTEDETSQIYYTFWNGSWAQPIPALTSPDGMANEPSITMSPSGRLLAVWSDLASGAIYFSEADPSEAVASGSWSSPIGLAGPSSPAVSPEIVAAADGSIYVTYVVPFNEERGIYLTRSTDAGQTWSTPSLLYDGRSNNRTSVGQQHLLVIENNTLHLLWQLDSLLQEGGASTLLYMRSPDGGENWTPVETVVEAPVVWSALVRGIGGNIYRIWQQSESGSVTLHFQFSSDYGESWSFRGILASVTADAAPAAVTVDLHGNVHLLQLTRRVLQHWIASQEGWVVAEQLDMEEGSLAASSSLEIAVDGSNRLFAAYVVLVPDEATGALENGVDMVNRSLDGAVVSGAPLATTAPAPAATLSVTATVAPPASPTPSPTPTLVFPTVFENEGNAGIPFLNSSNRWVRLAVALIPAVIIVLAVLVLRGTAIFHRR